MIATAIEFYSRTRQVLTFYLLPFNVSLLGFLTLLHSSCYENSSQLVYTLVLKRTSSYFTLHPELYTVAPCFESAPLRDKWLLISRKKRNTDEENARDLTEWVGRAGPTGDDTVVNNRKNTR